jgi:3-phosphoshikimate 1-carboxyvinyltransferase
VRCLSRVLIRAVGHHRHILVRQLGDLIQFAAIFIRITKMSISLDRSGDAPALVRPPKRVFVQAGRTWVGPEVSGQQSWPEEAPITVELPGSKYYTLRYLLNALLGDGESLVRFPAHSDDTAILVEALRALGAQVSWEPAPPAEQGSPGSSERGMPGMTAWQLRVRGTNGKLLPPPGGRLQMGNAGAALRLLLGLGALLPEVTYITDHPESLGRRPNADLLDALSRLGIQVEAEGDAGYLPISLRGGPPAGGSLTISGARSSQYLSALLYLGPLLPCGLEISVVEQLRSRPLVQATLSALATAGIQIEAAPDLMWFRVPGGQTFQARTYTVPGDGPTAAALLAAALALGRPLCLARAPTSEPDVLALMTALRDMGAEISVIPGEDMSLGSIEISAGRGWTEEPGLHGARIDGDPCIDSVPVLTALACFAQGETRFEGVATLRLKESDRISDLSTELERAGGHILPGEETITVFGKPEGILGGVTVYGHDDHRLVQALAIAGLRSAKGLTIDGADAVTKSCPEFFAILEFCGAQVAGVGVAPARTASTESPGGRRHRHTTANRKEPPAG